jgi:AcrR family transcriptional regulator
MSTAPRSVVPPRERTRHDIKDQALALFTQRGYAATSIADIATAAGCSKASVLYHFASKAAILSEVLEPTALQLDALVKRLLTYPLEQIQARAIDEFIEVVVQYRGLAVMLEGTTIEDEIPSFDAVADSCALLPQLLAGGTDADRLAAAGFALNGAIAECRDRTRDDQTLRAVLRMCMRRLLL